GAGQAGEAGRAGGPITKGRRRRERSASGRRRASSCRDEACSYADEAWGVSWVALRQRIRGFRSVSATARRAGCGAIDGGYADVRDADARPKALPATWSVPGVTRSSSVDGISTACAGTGLAAK